MTDKYLYAPRSPNNIYSYHLITITLTIHLEDLNVLNSHNQRTNQATTMPSFKSLLLLALPTLISASIHTIDVGENGLEFSPNNITAAVGDTVIFHFYPQHDVTQGPFDKPCTPTDGGFYSGAYSSTEDGKKKFVMNVTTTDPVYFYCSVSMHCKGGMVGGINVA
jgi:plastocyanin